MSFRWPLAQWTGGSLKTTQSERTILAPILPSVSGSVLLIPRGHWETCMLTLYIRLWSTATLEHHTANPEKLLRPLSLISCFALGVFAYQPASLWSIFHKPPPDLGPGGCIVPHLICYLSNMLIAPAAGVCVCVISILSPKEGSMRLERDFL